MTRPIDVFQIFIRAICFEKEMNNHMKVRHLVYLKRQFITESVLTGRDAACDAAVSGCKSSR